MRWRIFISFLLLAVLALSGINGLGAAARAETSEASAAFKAGYELLEKEDYYPAIKSFKLSLTDPAFPLLDYAYFYIAQAYQKSSHVEQALQVYEMVAQYFKNSVLVPQALFAMAQIQSQAKEYEASEKNLRVLISQYPRHELVPDARFLLGNDLEAQNNLEAAARAYRNLDLRHPKHDLAEKALEQLDKLAKNSSLAGYEAPAATVYNLGIKYFTKSNYTKAKGYFTRITKNYKKSSFYDEAVMMLGRISLRKGRLKTALNYFQKAVNLGKDSKPEAMYYLGLTYDYQDKPRAAIKTLEKLVEMYPNSHSADNALYFIAQFYRQLEEPEKAVVAYEKLLSTYVTSDLYPETIWLIGNMYYKDGRYDLAYEKFKQTLKLPAKNTSDRLLFWTGKCAEKIGRSAEAIVAYKTTITRYDHSYYAYRARERLSELGIEIKADAIAEVTDEVEELGSASPETIDHEKKYKALLALGLGDQAAEEAAFIEAKAPLNKKEKVSLAKYHAYVMKGKYSRPIWFADRKINEAMLSGNLSELDPRLWRFCYPRGYGGYVEKYSKMYNLDPHLTYAVIREESRFKSRALSRSWAHGLMQIIPSTGRNISKQLGFSYSRWKMYDPRVNIWMGTYYLSGLIKRFDGNVALALAGYNGGPVRVKRWTKKYKELDIDEFVEDIPFRETRNYVKKVMKSYYGYKRTYSDG